MVESAIIGAVGGAGLTHLYTAFKLRDRHPALAAMMTLLGLFFTGSTLFLASMVTGIYEATGQVLGQGYIGYFMAFFVFLMYTGILVYAKDALNLGMGKNEAGVNKL